MAERLTPFEAVFGRPGLAAEHFPRIAAARGAAGAPAPDCERFLMLRETGELMAEIAPEGAAGAAQIGLLTFHAFRHWQEGAAAQAIDAPTLGHLLRLERIGPWQLQTPGSAGYVQLPPHRLWVAGAAGQQAEPVDGFFWVGGDPAVNALQLLLVLGVHEARPGFTVIELSSGPLPPAGHWGDVPVRADGPDFGNVLPGGEHLHGLSTAGEVLKLAARVFWQLRSPG
ncbi:MAG: hypothetical protein FIB01_09665 [Gemmatimonadetes bacterium]|nr:hypothetical protein [Gemmatimonadota bacterium]